MKAIFASKLYQASPRKDRIQAQLNSPINSELVRQLSEYLDEDALRLADAIIPDVHDSNEDVDTSDDSREATSTEKGSSPSGSTKSAPSSSPHKIGDLSDKISRVESKDRDSEGDEPGDSSSGSSESSSETKSDESVEESVNIEGIDEVDVPDDRLGSDPVDETLNTSNIQDYLNSDGRTTGIRRVENKADELWIYYRDDINLNSIMEPVITLLSDKYSTCEFNRLARTENAIVFQMI